MQIHHIDGNHSNHNIRNLAVLCFDCHDKTQLKGGFGRKLDADQIILYRNYWYSHVEQQRSINDSKMHNKQDDFKFRMQVITTELEIYKDNKEYTLLAMHYNMIGNIELRDKYIELALKQDKDIDTEIFLRSLQGKTELVDRKKINREIKRMEKDKDWSQLARLHTNLGNWDSAIQYYLKDIASSLEEGNVFSAAFYLKELSENKLYNPLFEKAYDDYAKKGDLWWQVRSLQELGWDTELSDLLLKKRAEIEKSGDTSLQRLLYSATGEKENLIATVRRDAESTST